MKKNLQENWMIEIDKLMEFGVAGPIGTQKPKSTLRSKKDYQLDITTLKPGDTIEAYTDKPDKPIGRGRVVKVGRNFVELTDIEFIRPYFKGRGSRQGVPEGNRRYGIGPNGKLNGFKKIN